MLWDCFTKAEHIAQWWGPHAFTNPRVELDLRPGGKIHVGPLIGAHCVKPPDSACARPTLTPGFRRANTRSG